ncbi:hypothetical protein RO3G_09971 [Rhizopus delemar RA 99-880]|uniref:UAA transporter n=1 Tax=Rhizopus delemar (strain RA 99-880 / ATCC MYA-4621 / FGSC 9543 / NRRL 43880) TaxID=246409 RepID=I1C9Y1_RHIO9|nr:hypothetical protein RO3G_09971 [Rhizopus delemar RA 99-880]|eukprot:EIE85261.1 hypothetical protein RO3G_09971 [Rhizopus delemar RA 99-880]
MNNLHNVCRDAPRSGQMITFGQFLFTAVEGLRHQLTWGKYGPKLKKTMVPLTHWLLLVTLFFIVSLLNMAALSYNISIPLHIIFRSGGLIVNMIMGTIVLGKRYSFGQIFGVLFVTIGVIVATLDNASNQIEVIKKYAPVHAGKNNTGNTTEFNTGIALLVVAMILSAIMGLFQEVTYKKYGKHWREGLFYTHFLALPFFLIFSNHLLNQVHEYNKSTRIPISEAINQIPILVSVVPEPIRAVLYTIKIRKLWTYFIMNVVTQCESYDINYNFFNFKLDSQFTEIHFFNHFNYLL